MAAFEQERWLRWCDAWTCVGYLACIGIKIVESEDFHRQLAQQNLNLKTVLRDVLATDGRGFSITTYTHEEFGDSIVFCAPAETDEMAFIKLIAAELNDGKVAGVLKKNMSKLRAFGVDRPADKQPKLFPDEAK